MSTDLDFGVKPNLILDSVKYDELDDNFFGEDSFELLPSDDIIEEDYVKNPFYVGCGNSNLLNLEDGDLYKNYKRAIAICLKTGCTNTQSSLAQIYERILKKSDIDELGQNYILCPVSIKLLKNKFHHKTAMIIDRHILTLLNGNNIALESSEVVVPLFDLNENTVLLYNNMYESSYDAKTLIATNVIYQYLNCDSYNYIVLDRLSKIINDLKEVSYWSNIYNCKINITDFFVKRVFKYKKSTDETIKAMISCKVPLVQDSAAKNIIDKFSNKDSNKYDSHHFYRKSIFTDASSAISSSKKYPLYRIENEELDLNYQQVNDLFASISPNDTKLIFNLFNSLLLSKKYCHLVMNNKFVLEKMQPFFNSKLIVLYNYIFGYASLCMYFEECIMKTRTKNSNRYVFEIDTANKLPVFPVQVNDIHKNPYCVMTVDKKSLNSKNNFHGLPMIANYKEYGIDTFEGFVKKFNIFTTGRIDKNIFDGLETIENSKKWKYFAVSGSVIPACSQKRNPLIDQVTSPEMMYVDKMARYFNEYYNESDIDLMCNCVSVFDYMDNIQKLIDVIKKNLSELNGKENITLEVEAIKTLMICVNPKYIEIELGDIGSLDYIINNMESPSVKERFYAEYFDHKRKKNKQWRQIKKNGNPLYEDFYKIVSIDDMNLIITTYESVKGTQYESDSDTYVYLNDILPEDQQVDKSKNILVMKISESLKFKLKSPDMLHSIEAFRTRYDDFFSCVAKFHLPCVRGYYNGDNVYLLFSCVIALMTGINIDYKYFAGIRDPIDIINKYRMRGFGTMVNEKEKAYILDYNKVSKWKDMLNVDTNSKSSINEHFGPKKLNNNIYKPGKFFKNFPDDVYRNLDREYILTDENYVNYFKVNYGYDNTSCNFLKFNVIQEDGNIQPLKKWVLDAAFDELYK